MTQADKDTLFNQLKKDISETPPKLDNISQLLKQFVDGLCKFCPSKTELNNEIRNRFPVHINPEHTLLVMEKLIFTIEQFQAPCDDKITKKMLSNVSNNFNNESIIVFLSDFYDHTEKVYKDVWEARQRLINGENIVPQEHRKQVIGKNGIPFNMKTGL
uniref:Uncharacterized protein n=1 Tax=viral metagenome TaxID=1070528 RepID=A0A6C0AVA7_9ZZZZ|tara:strand:+ start:5910 stop:6386 length:477 start_codon:yes stop_codon:yes gene_type:complete